MADSQKADSIDNTSPRQKMYKIKINEEKEIEVEGGKSLLSTLRRQKIFIPTACGGKAKCGLCKLKVLEGAGPVLASEEPLLNDKEKQSNVRLSCQVKVEKDLKIIIPPELFAVKEYSCKCVEITDLNYDIKQLRFELPAGGQLDYTPGQYMHLFVPVYEKSSQPTVRAYSISSDPSDKNHIEFIMRLAPDGISTTYCFKYLKVGDNIRLGGPYGQFKLSDTNTPIVFIAGGSGISAIKCMLHNLKNTGSKRKAVLYLGANKVKDLCGLKLMSQFEKELADFKFIPAVASPDEGENWNGKTGLITQVVREDLKNAAESEAYLCGSPGMIDASVKVLKEMGTKEENIFYDKFE
ncbi:MAG: 2Fe-2S iron-sulfur cluster-binding protein [Planctomycetaceae bacterium]|nr:2Fe-2S iron-sulfur cluster-binding protein [Planctomycetaceae bacterium]